jgi:hypothetical protein
MTYQVRQDKVAAEVGRFPARVRRYWDICVIEIASDPHPRWGTYVDRPPLPGYTSRTFLYTIREETSISGEKIFVLASELLPEYDIIYAVNEDEREVEIFFLRESTWV